MVKNTFRVKQSKTKKLDPFLLTKAKAIYLFIGILLVSVTGGILLEYSGLKAQAAGYMQVTKSMSGTTRLLVCKVPYSTSGWSVRSMIVNNSELTWSASAGMINKGGMTIPEATAFKTTYSAGGPIIYKGEKWGFTLQGINFGPSTYASPNYYPSQITNCS